MTQTPSSRVILAGTATGPAIRTQEALSFWGGVDPATGCVIDVHHPLSGTCLTGGILFMPSSRGSCTGSGVLLDMVLSGRAPAALVFSEPEDVLTLGALIAVEMFGRSLPVIRLSAADFNTLSTARTVAIGPSSISGDGIEVPLLPPATGSLGVERGPPSPARCSTRSGPVSIVLNKGAVSSRGSAQNRLGSSAVPISPKAATN